ncbi:OsmC family protein [Natronoflexus pectinivorans]|uniref:Putative OsmC-like protein n=1 Tax=Natronoflexus pectinivorans TaxID=682526 RepID=A0A4V2RVS3_9BACT|nr:OsmC family protein [Natronoflexus pectinivorans]TCO05434.1 putative OsmC-like protein [Natronoflexus pectinivorans]
MTHSTISTKTGTNARLFSLVIDEPVNLGGTDIQTNPVEQALAGQAGCLNMMAHIAAKELGVKLNKLSVEISGQVSFSFNQDEPTSNHKFQSIDVNFQVYTDSDDEKLSRWEQIIRERCSSDGELSSSDTPLSIAFSKFASVY